MSNTADASSQRSSHTLSNTRGSSLIGCGGAALFGAMGLAALVGGNGFMALVAGLVAILAVAVLAAGIFEARHWGPLECTVPEWPLHLGESQTLRLTRLAKTKARTRQIEVSGELTCQEKVTYQQGTDTVTEKHVVYRQALSVAGQVADDLFDAGLVLDIPVESGGPTLELDNNEIIWRLELSLPQMSPVMNRVSFEIRVAPALSRSSRTIQDALPPQDSEQ